MRVIHFRAWHKTERRMYYRAYQKLLHVLLCEDDQGQNGGKGTPVKRAGFDDCELLESSSVIDIRGREVFEGDIVRISTGDRTIEGVVDEIPDMFKSRRIHPLHSLLHKAGIPDKADNLMIEVLGNRFEHPQLAQRC